MFGDHVLANEVSMLGNIGSRFTPYYYRDFIEDWHMRVKYVHHGQNKVRFNSLEPLKQEDIDWAKALMKERIRIVLDGVLEKRKEKVSDAESTRTYLEEGNYFYAKDALKMGLIDRITTPNEFFREHFGKEKYTIGEVKLSFWSKVAQSMNSSNYSEVILDETFENLGLEDENSDMALERQIMDPISHFHKTAYSVPHLSKDSYF